MVFLKLLGIIVFTFASQFSFAAKVQIFDGSTGKEASLADIAGRVSSGMIVVMGEVHNSKDHHENQRQLLRLMSGAPFNVNVGMEFFNYTRQLIVDQFLAGILSEAEFLKKLPWSSGDDFSDYREQVLYPLSQGGKTLAINAPRSLTSKVSKSGLSSLTPEDQNLLPPGFTLGRSLYKDLFRDVMGGHVSEEKLEDYFAAQSIWDDTMAWQTSIHQQIYPKDVTLIIVGDFHVAYGGGLPDRLKARSQNNLLTISQISLQHYPPGQNVEELVTPDLKYGARGDFIIVTEQ